MLMMMMMIGNMEQEKLSSELSYYIQPPSKIIVIHEESLCNFQNKNVVDIENIIIITEIETCKILLL